MFRSHIFRIFNSKTSWLAFTIILLIPMLEILLLLNYQKNSNEIFHPAFAFFLSSSSIGHAPQIILLWFLPIFLLLLGAEDGIQDYKTGYRNILISKVGRAKYFVEKLITSFVISFITMFFTLLLNFVLVSIIFKGGTFSKSILEMEATGNPLLDFSINHPFYVILLFSIISSFLAGLVGMLGASMSLFFLDRKYTYPASFFIWFLMVLNKDSVIYLFQPFAEYGINDLLPILQLSLAILILIPIMLYIYGVKFNDN